MPTTTDPPTFWEANKGKITAVAGAVFLALGGYLTGQASLPDAIAAVVNAVDPAE